MIVTGRCHHGFIRLQHILSGFRNVCLGLRWCCFFSSAVKCWWKGSVGFTIADYGFVMALVCCTIIGGVTLAVCLGGIVIGKKLGTKLAGKAGILGGIILILIGVEIFVKGAFF